MGLILLFKKEISNLNCTPLFVVSNNGVQFNLVPLPLKNNGMKKKDPEAFSSGPLVKFEYIFLLFRSQCTVTIHKGDTRTVLPCFPQCVTQRQKSVIMKKITLEKKVKLIKTKNEYFFHEHLTFLVWK